MAISQNFSTVRPSLNLNFARSKTLDPRITFSRSSTATYVGSDGLIKTSAANEPRFDHDPATGKSLGLLIEAQSTNRITNSQVFSSTGIWNFEQNLIQAPDGTLTGGRYIRTSGTATTLSQQYVANTTYVTFSFFVHTSSTVDVPFLVRNDTTGTNLQAVYWLSSTNQFSDPSYEITRYPNGWVRGRITQLSGISVGNLIRIYYGDIGGAQPGNVNKYFYLWGMQLEDSLYTSSYIPTSDSTVTRNADDASIIGTNFSSWYNQNEGTMLWEGIFDSYGSSGSNDALFSINDGTGSDNRFSMRPRNTLATVTGSSFIEAWDWGYPLQNNTVMKGAFAIKSGDYALVTSGIVRNTSSNSSLPQPNRITAFNAYEGGPITGIIHHKRMVYYPERLTNSQLQNLTK